MIVGVLRMAVADFVAEAFETDVVRAALAWRGVRYCAVGPWSAGPAAILLLDAAGNHGGPGGGSGFARGGAGKGGGGGWGFRVRAGRAGGPLGCPGFRGAGRRGRDPNGRRGNRDHDPRRTGHRRRP